MTASQIILDALKKDGHRLTPARIELIDIVLQSKKPLAADEILKKLSARKTAVNKTTVYREIEFLTKEKVLTELHLGERKLRYEMAGMDHHHHLVCVDCKNVEDFVLAPEAIQKEHAQERQIASKKKFKVISHRLEFFGICKNCL